MGHKAKLRGGAEWDAFSRRAKRILCYLNRPGVCKAIKRAFNKRQRRNIDFDKYGWS